MNVLTKKFSIAELRAAKEGQHREGLFLTGQIPAGQSSTVKVEVGTAGAVVTMRMAGYFTTLDDIGTPGGAPHVPHIIDDGICHLRGQLIDTDKNLALFNDFVPLNLFLSPGRMRVKNITMAGVVLPVENYIKPAIAVGFLADTAAPSSFLYEPQEFTHPFTVNSYVRIDVKNDAAADNIFAMYFDVIRVTRK